MALADEILTAQKKVVTDGYEMSLGEIINLYRDGELIIDPVFQRLFRWDDEQKTSFIESIILGIPFPPIFVSQRQDGIWELIDGLQRISTVLQLTSDLRGDRAIELGDLVLNGTRFLPSLSGKRWKDSSPGAGDGLDQSTQISIKRSRIRIEILKSNSDMSAKFELFQRLNTGGANLSKQEVRNSIAISINKKLYDWIINNSEIIEFKKTTAQTDVALEKKEGVELAFRFFAFRNIPYKNGLDVHEYLDEALLTIASSKDFDMDNEEKIFRKTFEFINNSLGDSAFKRWDGNSFKGKFLMSVYEVVSIGVSMNIDNIEKMEEKERNLFIKNKSRDLWKNKIFQKYSGAGIRGTTRLSKLLPIASEFFRT